MDADNNQDPALSVNDLYGPSTGTATGETDDSGSAEVAEPSAPLTYEETPIIEPVREEAPATNQPVSQISQTENVSPNKVTLPEYPERPPRRAGCLGNLILFILLFAAGIGASMLLRNFVPGFTGSNTTQVSDTPTPTAFPEQSSSPLPLPEETPPPEKPTIAADSWTTHRVLRAYTKDPAEGITFQLPPEILVPICDSVNCSSSGTYLPGGTRLTVAVYENKLTQEEFKNTVITDSAGRSFETKSATVSERPALEFSGSFTGSTTGGFRFSRMHGFMILVDNKTRFEINHFTPSSVAVDFEADDKLFGEIIKTVQFSRI